MTKFLHFYPVKRHATTSFFCAQGTDFMRSTPVVCGYLGSAYYWKNYVSSFFYLMLMGFIIILSVIINKALDIDRRMLFSFNPCNFTYCYERVGARQHSWCSDLRNPEWVRCMMGLCINEGATHWRPNSILMQYWLQNRVTSPTVSSNLFGAVRRF